MPEVCRGCAYERSCQGGCKESAFATFGDHAHPEPLLWLAQNPEAREMLAADVSQSVVPLRRVTTRRQREVSAEQPSESLLDARSIESDIELRIDGPPIHYDEIEHSDSRCTSVPGRGRGLIRCVSVMRRTVCSLSIASVVSIVGLASGDASAAVGGPDLGGYSFADQVDGAVYNYVDITGTGALVASGIDDVGPIVLGAPFDFYGNVVPGMLANSNGFLTSSIASGIDSTNDCALPVNPSTGGGFRIYALHDDVVTDVFYQYFDEVAAVALGYPGETQGISVVQWIGNHNGGGGAVDFEVILFHDDFSILNMVATDAENGLSSTMGIQNARATTGLTYTCNIGGAVTPGTTAVLYTRTTDSDCCNASPTGTPGCTNLPCQETVCALDGFCCSTSWDGVCATDPVTGAAAQCQVLCGAPPPVSINEFRIDQPGADNDEYFEIVGPPGTPLTDIQYIVLGDFGTGELEAVVDLTGQVIPASGVFVAAEGTFTLGVADLTTTMNFENLDTFTHLLVGGLATTLSDNLDFDNDGVLEGPPWITALDTVAIIHPPSADLPYGPGSSCVAGPFCQQIDDGIDVPQHIYRCPDGNGPFLIGNDDPATMPVTDSPGGPNPCMGGVCGDGMVDPGEDCDDMGESAMCDADCTLAVCGDGTTNMTAGEDCDDMGESAACDADCTAAVCGDGTVNVTAGETCDDMGESAMCDSDCTAVTCGDGVVNMTAGEACDDAGESAACDADCTLAMCGDGNINMTAGEICDDMGESAMCDADCTPSMCGDGVTNMTAGEACDDGGESAMCDTDCTVAMCGDMVVNNTAGETCDDGGRSAVCDSDCTAVTCGDGVVNMTAGEQCDDAGESATCDDDCTDAMCGDMLVNMTAGEACDDGGESATCDDDCTDAMCGDGTVNATAGEDCDGDGMGMGGETDTCNDDCTAAACGDGITNMTAGEECDDAGESDTCDDDCTAAECGDDTVNATAGEECDDGNTDDGDGCASDCTMEDDPGTTDDTGADTTEGPADTTAADSTGGSGGGSGGSTSGPSTISGGPTSGETDGETDTDTDTTTGAVPGDEGCNCSTEGERRGGAPWSLLALFGLGTLRRRRRR